MCIGEGERVDSIVHANKIKTWMVIWLDYYLAEQTSVLNEDMYVPCNLRVRPPANACILCCAQCPLIHNNTSRLNGMAWLLCIYGNLLCVAKVTPMSSPFFSSIHIYIMYIVYTQFYYLFNTHLRPSYWWCFFVLSVRVCKPFTVDFQFTVCLFTYLFVCLLVCFLAYLFSCLAPPLRLFRSAKIIIVQKQQLDDFIPFVICNIRNELRWIQMSLTLNECQYQRDKFITNHQMC